MSEKDDIVKAAIEAVQEERRQLAAEIMGIQEELTKKQERLRSLITFIEHGKLLIDADSQPVADGRRLAIFDKPIAPKDAVAPNKATVADRITVIFQEQRGPLKPRNIAQEFYNRGWPLSPKNGAEVVRYTMKKKEELFVSHIDGTFSLKVS
jgi:hypothetical protein